jgi:hypothetical protein
LRFGEEFPSRARPHRREGAPEFRGELAGWPRRRGRAARPRPRVAAADTSPPEFLIRLPHRPDRPLHLPHHRFPDRSLRFLPHQSIRTAAPPWTRVPLLALGSLRPSWTAELPVPWPRAPQEDRAIPRVREDRVVPPGRARKDRTSGKPDTGWVRRARVRSRGTTRRIPVPRRGRPPKRGGVWPTGSRLPPLRQNLEDPRPFRLAPRHLVLDPNPEEIVSRIERR